MARDIEEREREISKGMKDDASSKKGSDRRAGLNKGGTCGSMECNAAQSMPISPSTSFVSCHTHMHTCTHARKQLH